MGVRSLRAPRANRDFCTDKRHISTEIAVIVNIEQTVGFLYKIGDRVRMCLSSVRDRQSVRTGRRPRKLNHRSSMSAFACADEHA
ncbi:MAG: hypothetical protein D4R74_07565 [Betaproteobacteria bacterium]|nr:MAG: hypothetical protein D4R74_07565 [Betaproteobacteria bacterium]